MVTVINYKMGNIGSVLNMLKYLKIESKSISSPVELKKSSMIILPGVGSFDSGIKNLKELGFFDKIRESAIKYEVPVLGICLGMQLLTQKSEEGTNMEGLSLIEGETVRFDSNNTKDVKIPHMGWNFVTFNKNSCFKFDVKYRYKFYFVHSYHVKVKYEKDILSTTEHGVIFNSSVMKKNVVGVQFHPEKSHKYGMEFIKKIRDVLNGNSKNNTLPIIKKPRFS